MKRFTFRINEWLFITIEARSIGEARCDLQRMGAGALRVKKHSTWTGRAIH